MIKTMCHRYAELAPLPVSLRGKPRPKHKFGGASPKNWAFKPQAASPVIVTRF